jgi:hypothetical protein
VLAVITGAFRDLLLAAGDQVDGVVIRSLVPVNVRHPATSRPTTRSRSSLPSCPSASLIRSNG